MSTTDRAIDSSMRAEVIDALLSKVHAYYIFPAVAQEMEQAIRRRLSNGEYDALTTGEALCETLTAHLQEVSNDKHLCVVYSAEPRPLREERGPSPEEREEFRQFGVLHNFGFTKVERLAGNVGVCCSLPRAEADINHAQEGGAECLCLPWKQNVC